MLACDVRNINQDWIDWNDEGDQSYDKHNMIFDFSHRQIEPRRHRDPAHVVESEDVEIRLESEDVEISSNKTKLFPVFSIVKSWSRAQGNHE